MIDIKKKDVLIGYLGYFLKLFSNILVLPVILNKLTGAEYGLWSVFLSLGALTALLDMGFGSVLVRYTTYAFCGAKKIPKEGIPEVGENGSPNFILLFSILSSAKKIYRRMGLLALCLLLLSTVYIVHITVGKIQLSTVLIAWTLYCTGVALSMYFSYYNYFYKGLGKVGESQIIVIKNQIFYIFLQLVLLHCDLALIAVAASNFLAALLLRFQLSCKVNAIIKKNLNEYEYAGKQTQEKEVVFKAITHNSKGLGYVLISNFLQNQGSTLLCAFFLDLETVGRFGLTTQLIGIINALSAMPFTTYIPKMSFLQLTKKSESLKDIYSLVTVLSFALFLLGGIVLLVTGDLLMSAIDSKTVMLPFTQTLLLLFYYLILANHQRCTSFISLRNIQPYIKAYVISSFMSLTLSTFLLFAGMDIWGIIISNILVQVCYNAWKWPLVAQQVCKVTVTELFMRAVSLGWGYLKNVFV